MQIANFFPTGLFVTQLLVTTFFGFAMQNGAFKGLAARLVYLTKGRAWALPLVGLVASAVVAMLGGGVEATPLVMSPLLFMLSAEAGFNPLLAAAACYYGSCWGSQLPFASGGQTVQAMAAQYVGQEYAAPMHTVTWIYMLIGFVITFLIAYFLTGAHKLKTRIAVEKPAPFTQKEKQGLTIVIVFVLILLIPNIIKAFAPNSVFAYIAAHVDARFLAMLGSLVFILTGLGDARDVIKNYVPWGVFVMIGGVCMFFNLAVNLGVVQLIADFVGSNIPTYLIPCVILVIGGLLSFVTSGVVVQPMLLSMVLPIAAATGLHPALLAACCFCSTPPTGVSPISQGGAMAVLGASEEVRSKIFGKQVLVGLLSLLIFAVLSLVGVLNLLGSIILK